MKTKFINAQIITVNDNFDVLKKGSLYVDNNLIVAIFDNEKNKFVDKTENFNLSEFDNCKTIDCENNILMPGLINTHSHAAMSEFRGLADGVLFENWWHNNILPLEQKMTAEDVKNGVSTSVKEMLQNGITTYFDMYFNWEEAMKVSGENGIRMGVAFGAINGINDTINESILKEQFDKIVKQKLTYPFVYAHSVYSCDEEQFAKLVKFAKQNNLVFSTHASETLTEVGTCHNLHGVTPIGLLEEMGVFEVPCVLAHCVHVDKDDIAILKQYSDTVSVAHNPMANLKLGSGIAPITALKKAGINIALGTDGPASNNSLDILKEMNLSVNLQSGILNNPQAISAEEAIKMATVNGVKAFRINNLGQLKSGYLADIIMLNTNLPNMKPGFNVVNDVVFSASNKNVCLTMVDGKIVYNYLNK